MAWYKEFGLTEIIFIALFAVFYAGYLFRVIRLGIKLKTPYHRIFIKLALRSVYFALFIVALLGPSYGGSKKEVKSVGKDIMICVDLSKSMDAFDIQPTRLEKIKYELKKIVDAFNSDRIGVVIFSSEAFMQCPLTYDQNALNLFIETMNSGLVPGGGTDFGPPLKMALSKLTEETEGPSTQAKSKVIILISDGEDFGDDTDAIANKIENESIKLFALGIGTQQGGNIYAANGLKRDREGKVVLTKLNAESLQKIANKTDGQYFEINDSRNDVSRMINTIGKIEGELRDAKMLDVTANKYFYYLLAAAVLLLVDIVLSLKTVKI
ncbi:vWA domain-containing protein [Pseudochryseolinea flava]|uniref:Aerotolerance regulator BatB n=1 Tax=Pseudochryseolinea flava TaxID=2059302 RepID=A0A364Y169_9BACT|nr:VWA domain-containing protein [Pseudochryseolinea flava]RAV99677.1 aerotolerance regulator BatB [Pseudochryseolinea flava]